MPTNGQTQFTIQVTIKHILIYAIVIVLIAAVLAYAFSKADSDTRSVISYGSSLFGAMVALLALLYTAQNIKQTNDEKKSVAAAKFIERWNSPSYSTLKDQWWKLNEELDQLSPQGRATLLGTDSKKKSLAVEVLNFFEEMSAAINTETVDEELLKRFFKSIVVAYWDRYSDWIASHRRNPRWPKVYVEFEQVAKRWGER